ncbi:ABC transporter substrate-binding protein [Rouxiella badensis]|jgi:oligopeptide transport system substrate-binding protein|uniref:Oligopeptide ABC transporter substrate-binding protein OppA n=1 Tax=Rouxiella badensis TaxID=1646377 RepID=A0A1X0WGB5_9GAMM|nr:ABC transporter substrate-binding protein [Rouxiella badensis]MCC3717722.1 ABC transporter substrate-binding protein [Rouxiella badensis]MCC3727334.1 ABC transporter substrate-binding protein [Rouxiella badensis]MCC3734973.1 ABC transporter substrate-binding protein [Rouxiella badensis]MCC3739065.1 ABC transporter substrate-binding protein [Rouxiella badensis]MCC3758566.1 ABC transporter substrate-binding protein [Rouxiella badensis]
MQRSNTFGKRLPLVLLVSGFCLSPLMAQAATVPQGVVLAQKQEIVRNNGSEPATLDVHKAESNVESNILSDLFVGLVSIDDNGNPRPELAASWDTKDNKTWVFHLRPGLRWSDGSPITAQDVVYSWRRLIDPKTVSPYESYLGTVHVLNADSIIAGKTSPDRLGVKALDAQTVQVELDRPMSYFLQMISHYSLFPVSQADVEKYGDKWTQPGNLVSSGPFKLKSWTVNERVVAERNPNYWDNAHTVLSQVTYLPIASGAADVNRYKAGEIDITLTIPEVQFASLKKELGSQVHTSPYLGVYYYAFNNQKPPFNDVRVRQALSLGIDRGIIADKVLGQGQTAAYTITPDNTGGYTFKLPAVANMTQDQRNAEARKLLAEAGFGPQHPLKFNLLYNTSESHQHIAIAAASMWKKNLGVTAVLQNQEWKTMLDTMHQGNYDVVRYAWIADYNEPSTFLNTFRSDNSENTPKFHDADYDKVLDDALAATSKDQVQKDYQKAEDILNTQAPVVPLYHYVSAKLVKPYIGGFDDHDPQGRVFAKNLYVIKH